MRMRRLSVLALLVCGVGGCPASDDAATDATPLGLSLDPMACGLEPGTESYRGLLTLSLDGTSVQVSDANDATLVTSAGTHAVELERAISGDFGERSLFFELLVMQVQ